MVGFLAMLITMPGLDDHLAGLGDHDDRNAHTVQRRDIVEGLVGEKSVNIVVGNSGLGKTPWLVQLCVCVAAGVDFMGRKVQQGPVLYEDSEMNPHDFHTL